MAQAAAVSLPPTPDDPEQGALSVRQTPNAAPPRRCSHTTKAGTPCRWPPLVGRDVCVVHCNDPENVAQQAKARWLGGGLVRASWRLRT